MLQVLKLYNEVAYEQIQKGIFEVPKKFGRQRFVEGPFLNFHDFSIPNVVKNLTVLYVLGFVHCHFVNTVMVRDIFEFNVFFLCFFNQ